MLVERDELIGELIAALSAALAGHGRLIFLGGEAGVGKSTLVRALADAAAGRCRVRVGGVDNVTTADALAAFQDAVPEILPRLAAGGDRVGLFRALREILVAEPCLVVLEDLHWADEATLDALRFLGRRLDGAPVLIVATYRHDEVTARHPLATLMGDLATVPRVGRLFVPPLTAGGVAVLADEFGVDVDPAALHVRTGGNAFFVTELLAGGGEAMPATVSDAILARLARLSPAAQDAASAAAVLGTAADATLIASVAGRDLEAVDSCVDPGILVADGDRFGFRHELARQAVDSGLSAVRRRQLHGRALRELTRTTPEDHRTLAHHAAGCGDDKTAAREATLAGRRAARLSAHREAAVHFRTALHYVAGVADRAQLFVALSYECYLTDQLPESITARQRALELHDLMDDRGAVGDDERWLSRLSWFLGRSADAERYAARAIASLELREPGPALAMAYSNLAQLRMLSADDGEAELWGGKALALATELGETEIESHALNNTGVAALRTGRIEVGNARLVRSLDLALGADLQEHAARAYTNLGSIAVEQRRYVKGLGYLDEGVAYSEERDLDSWARYMQAWRATALGDLGRFDESLAAATAVLGNPDVSPVSAIPAAAAAARILARRGEDAETNLALATSLAAGTGELQRIGAAACAAAEDAWLRGEVGSIASDTDAAWALAGTHSDPWAAGELVWWRMLGGIAVPADVEMAEPFALMVAHDDAAPQAWEDLGSPLWASYARVLAPDAAAADIAVRTLDNLGATQSVQALLRSRRDAGLPLPRRPHATARAHPAQLTNRELDVLRLLARGLSTAEIADELVLSPRTVEHHISAVLRKLREPTRARAVAAALASGTLDG